MTINVRVSVPEDLDMVENPLPVFETEKKFLYRLKNYMRLPHSKTFTFLEDTKVIGVIGTYIGNDGYSNGLCLWAWLDVLIKKYPKDFSKKTKEILEEYLYGDHFPFKVSFAQVYMKKNGGLERWAKFLGFKRFNECLGFDGQMYFDMRRVA